MGAGERDEFLRAAWRALVAEEVDADRLVFVDEMGANVSLSALYAWSRKGERAFGSAPRTWGKNVMLVASITEEGVGPCLVVEGSTTREVFEAYLEGVLGPTLSPGLVVVMDNLSAHKGERVREIVEGCGCELCCTCLPTPPRTSTQSSRPSRSSRDSCDGPRHAPAKHSDRGDGTSALGDDGPRGPRLLRTLRLP